ncbi:MAG: DUF4192 family protein [Cryobacterium sp.]
MSKHIVRTAKACDFLALVPQLVGFHPENSIVLVAMRGNRSCGALRFNLPDPDAPQRVHQRIATSLVGTICKIPGADALVPVTYTDDSFAAARGIPHDRFTESLISRAQLSGFLVRDALCVGSDAWGSYLDPECPAEGHPLTDITASAATTGIPAEVRQELATVHSGTELPDVDLAAKERVARRYRRLARGSDCSGAASVPLLRDLVDTVGFTERFLAIPAAALSADDAALLLFTMQPPSTRDQMMLQIAFGREAGFDARESHRRYSALQKVFGGSLGDIVAQDLAGLDDSRIDDSRIDDAGFDCAVRAARAETQAKRAQAWQIGSRLIGTCVDRPDPARCSVGIAVLKRVVALAPRSTRPAPLCMLAWLSWALGRGTVAGLFLEQALSIDEQYSMALLLNEMLGSGRLPEWAFFVPPD